MIFSMNHYHRLHSLSFFFLFRSIEKRPRRKENQRSISFYYRSDYQVHWDQSKDQCSSPSREMFNWKRNETNSNDFQSTDQSELSLYDQTKRTSIETCNQLKLLDFSHEERQRFIWHKNRTVNKYSIEHERLCDNFMHVISSPAYCDKVMFVKHTFHFRFSSISETLRIHSTS